MTGWQSDRLERQRADIERRAPLERRIALDSAIAAERRTGERRAAMRRAIESARFNAALADWHARRSRNAGF